MVVHHLRADNLPEKDSLQAGSAFAEDTPVELMDKAVPVRIHPAAVRIHPAAVRSHLVLADSQSARADIRSAREGIQSALVDKRPGLAHSQAVHTPEADTRPQQVERNPAADTDRMVARRPEDSPAADSWQDILEDTHIQAADSSRVDIGSRREDKDRGILAAPDMVLEEHPEAADFQRPVYH